jgi:two-component system, NarL family, sensor histidine kinase DesK
MRLLPKDEGLGWTPYAFLAYLAFFLIGPALSARSNWALTIAAVAVFLPLYFWCYWLTGQRKLIAIAGIAAIGGICASYNPGASTFFIFAACFLGEVAAPAIAFRYLGVLLAFIGLQSWLMNLSMYFWAPAILISALLGSVNIHFAQQHRMTKRLLMAQCEIERLAKIAERERIARDLHDLLGHTLSCIVLKSELASRLATRDPARAAREMQEVERISRDALSQVRAAVSGFGTTSLDSEIEQAKRVLETAGIVVSLDVDKPGLSTTEDAVLGLALREAVTNIVRHSQAARCEIRIKGVTGGCELEVHDDGAGSDAAEGFGLGSMRHRVESLGGTLERESSAGTRLRIWLPARQAHATGAA